MALSTKALFAFCHSPVGTNRIPPIGGNSNPFTLTHLPTAHKWSIAQDHTLASSPLEHYNGGSRFHTDGFSVEHAEKLEAFKHVLRSVGEDEDPFEGLNMIDAIQRLSIDYHFQEEIEKILRCQFVKSSTHGDCINRDLHGVSLSFRLLRQQGYNIPADVFNNFKDKEGKFNKELSEDVDGLMGLYEASQLSVKGEDILDEAGNFSGQQLNALVTNLDHYQARVVGNTLEHPFHKTLPRFMARNYFGNLQATNGWINDLQALARMDFHMVQSIYQKEVVQITKWCRDLGLAKELSLARDQPLKWYIWSMACLTDPDLSEQRVDLTKSISLIYIIDDIFDVYGTLDELTLFTEAVNKWDFAALEPLPEYMKICFKALCDIINEISYKIYQKHGWNPMDSLRKTWASLCNAFLVEAQWFASGHSPKAEEYLKNGVISSGVHVVLVQIFFLLGQGITEESADLVNGVPDIISSTATILRLWDDLGSAKDENQDGHDGSYIDYYMKEHKGSSTKEAREHVISMISDSWKRLNKECFFPNPLFPTTFTKASLNFARMVPLMYNYDDNQHLPSLEEHMKSVLYERVYV